MPHLTDPIKIGPCALNHRIILAPMTRLRATATHVPTPLLTQHYAQRASVPGTLLITEATFVSPTSRGRGENAPGIYTPAQITAWRKVTDAVHARGSSIFVQLWHVGRAAREEALKKAGLEMVSSSAVPISDAHLTPRAMTTDEIDECIQSFAQAARNAMEAGFDGVEIHAANGYLIDQFTQDTCNKRTDEWGNSIENRSRFCLEITRAVAGAIGANRTAVRLSPFSDFQGMRMQTPLPQFTHLISHLRLGLAYLHLIEPTVAGNTDKVASEAESLDFAMEAWGGAGPVVLAGGYTLAKAERALGRLEGEVAFAFGRHFISNPDLPFRLVNEIGLVEPDRGDFYRAGDPKGYIDYAFSGAWNERFGAEKAP